MKPDVKPETLARIRFTAPKAAWRPPTGRRYSTLCRFEGEGNDAPYGRWTLLMEFWENPVLDQDVYAWVKPLSDGAPPLRRDLHFTLFEGPYVIGEGTVVKVRTSTDGRRDQDVFRSLYAAPLVGDL